MSNDYLFNAADTVRRKSLSALEVQSNAEAVMRSHAVGLADGAQHQSGDPALAAETERALAQSLAALDEIANQDGKENRRDG